MVKSYKFIKLLDNHGDALLNCPVSWMMSLTET